MHITGPLYHFLGPLLYLGPNSNGPTKNPRPHSMGKPTQFNTVDSTSCYSLSLTHIAQAMGADDNTVEQQPQGTASLDSVDALLEAARYDDKDDIMSIASTGVSLNSKDSEGRTALHMASANGHLGIVQYLICNGADVNACNLENNTPLHWASLNGHIEVVKYLILAGANVSLLNSHERSPIDEAVSRGSMHVIDAFNEASAQLELAGTQVS